MKQMISCLLMVSLVTVASCSKDNDGGGGTTLDCTPVPKSYTTDVNPIVQSRCAIAGCHASGSGNGPGALVTYSQLFNARTAIRSSVASGRMPQGSTLTTAEKNSILCWIDSGAPNN